MVSLYTSAINVDEGLSSYNVHCSMGNYTLNTKKVFFFASFASYTASSDSTTHS